MKVVRERSEEMGFEDEENHNRDTHGLYTNMSVK